MICQSLIDWQIFNKKIVLTKIFPVVYFLLFLYSYFSLWICVCLVPCQGLIDEMLCWQSGSIFIRIRVCVNHQCSFFSSIMPSSSGEPSNYTLCILSVKRRGQSLLDGLAKGIKKHHFHFDSNLSLYWILWMYVITHLILCFHCHETSTFNLSSKFDSVHCVHWVHCVHCVNCLAGVVRSIWSWSTHCHWWQLRSIANPS